jgi:hypothetical protein
MKAEPYGKEVKGDGFPPHLGIFPWGVGSRGGKWKVWARGRGRRGRTLNKKKEKPNLSNGPH